MFLVIKDSFEEKDRTRYIRTTDVACVDVFREDAFVFITGSTKPMKVTGDRNLKDLELQLARLKG